MPSFYELMGASPVGFDPEHQFVTSWILPPTILAVLRLLISIYCFATTFTDWGWYAVHGRAGEIGHEFSYFTHFTFWGITFYMLVASMHGFVYVQHGQSWLDRWIRPLQVLHSLLYTSVTTFPILVTVVYWSVLYQSPWYPIVFDAWSNISCHGLNSLFALLEILIPATNPQPWLHLPLLSIVLALYLALAYLTHYAQGWYPYSFLNPSGGHRGRVAAYVFGILAAITVIFLVVWAIIWLRRRFTGSGKKCKRDIGPNYNFAMRRRDLEMIIK